MKCHVNFVAGAYVLRKIEDIRTGYVVIEGRHKVQKILSRCVVLEDGTRWSRSTGRMLCPGSAAVGRCVPWITPCV